MFTVSQCLLVPIDGRLREGWIRDVIDDHSEGINNLLLLLIVN